MLQRSFSSKLRNIISWHTMTTSFEHAVYAQSIVLLLIYVKLPYDCKEFYTFVMLHRLLEHIREVMKSHPNGDNHIEFSIV